MTLPATARRAGPFNGNGVTTVFPFTFKVFSASDITVIKTSSGGVESTLALNSDYTVTLNGDQDASPGGSITYPVSGSALASGEKLSAVGALAYDQTLDLPSGGNFSPIALENALDRIEMQIQQVDEATSRSLTLPVSSSSGVSTELPAPEAGKVIGWDSAGAALQNLDVNTLASIVAYGTANSDIFSGTGSQTVFTLSANPASINNLDVSISGVSQRPGIDYLWTTGTTVTFTTAPVVGTNNILIRYMQALAFGSAAASDVNFTPAGTGAVATTVQEQLRQIVTRSSYNSDTNFNNAAVGRVSINGSNKVTAPRFEGTATDDAGTPDAIFRVSRTHTTATSPHAFRDQTVFSPAVAALAACSFDAALVSGGSSNMDHTIGFQARNVHSGSGTLTNLYGLGSYPIVTSGTVTNVIGLDVAPHSGGGTVTNEYGIYIRNQNAAATNKYPIYVANNLGTNSIGAATNFNGSGVVSVGGPVKIFMGDAGSGYKSIAYNHNMQTNTYDYGDQIQSMYFGPQDITFRSAPVGTAGATPTFTNIVSIRTDSTNANFRALFPTTDNVSNLGVSGLRWKEIFCANGVINTSDARAKTEVRELTAQEISAAKDLAKAIGGFKWLMAVAEKGDSARTHIGMTVQRAIEIMKSNGLDPKAYGFICFDEWEAEYEDHPAIYEQVVVEPEEVKIIPAYTTEVIDQVKIDGNLTEIVRTVEIPEQRRIIKEAVLGNGKVLQEAWRETRREAGNTYGFRADQLTLFILRGLEARLSALESD